MIWLPATSMRDGARMRLPSDALRVVEKREDVEAVQAVIRAVYLPWLETCALAFQKTGQGRLLFHPGEGPPSVSDMPRGTAILFADGLRFDLAQQLRAEVGRTRASSGPGLEVDGAPHGDPHRQAGCVAHCGVVYRGPRLRGVQTPDEGRRQRVEQRALQAALGGAWVSGARRPEAGAAGWRWLAGVRKHRQHRAQGRLEARQADPRRVERPDRGHRSLLDAGWKKVRVVTDHGWLLMPGGLPKIDLPKFLVETRWGRCALVKEGAQSDLPSVPWHWDSTVQWRFRPVWGPSRWAWSIHTAD